jgi:HAD superfamily hydrolase (TIGR01509 family)
MLQALLFDLDGTLSDTDPLHLRAWQECLRDRGTVVDETFYRTQISGRTTPAVVKNLFPHFDDQQVADFSAYKEATFRALAGELKALFGLKEVLALAHQRRWKCALVTNGSRENAMFMLQTISLATEFDAMVFGEELQIGKPDPLPYRIALQELQQEARTALAFEDSITGLRSAIGAGLRTIGVATSQSANDLLDAGATMVIRDFSDRGLWELLS